MKLGIISDTHDRVENTEKALTEFRLRGVERIIHCGDVTSPSIVYLFAELKADFTLGNCDWDPDAIADAVGEIGGELHPEFGEIEIEGRRIAWTHSHLADLFHRLQHSGEYDFVFYGHTHVAKQQYVGRTLVVNPGALHRVRGKTCAVLDVPSGTLESIWLCD